MSAVVVSGILARYHLLPNGRRQYLSFHLAGDMPDSQALFIEKMDHAVCAMGSAVTALIPHKDLLSTFERRPSVGFAIWRETLIDAAIFREAITNNSARTTMARLAHLFCELFYRAKASGLTQGPARLRCRSVSFNWLRRSVCRLRLSIAHYWHCANLARRNFNEAALRLRIGMLWSTSGSLTRVTYTRRGRRFRTTTRRSPGSIDRQRAHAGLGSCAAR